MSHARQSQPTARASPNANCIDAARANRVAALANPVDVLTAPPRRPTSPPPRGRAFVYVAIYGTSFTTAGKAVFRLVEAQGLTTILTSLVADSVLGYGMFFASLFGSACAYVVASAEEDCGTLVACAFLLSWLVGATCLSPVRAAIRTTLVCYAEAPGVLRSLEPQLHDAYADIKAKSVMAGVAPTVQGVPVGSTGPSLVAV